MNTSQFHLALTHVPVVLSLVGLVILLLSFLKKSNSLTKTAFYLLLFAGLFAIPVYLTGEGAEEVVEHLPGVSENIIQRHEEVANIALIIILVSGVASIGGLVVSQSGQLARIAKLVVLVLSMGAVAAMAQTAHLGGQIRHTEIRSAFVSNGNNEGANSNGEQSKKEDKQDND